MSIESPSTPHPHAADRTMTRQTLLDERPPRRATRPTLRDATATLPETMRAVVIDRHGGLEAMALLALPRPVPAATEVLIALHTAGCRDAP